MPYMTALASAPPFFSRAVLYLVHGVTIQRESLYTPV